MAYIGDAVIALRIVIVIVIILGIALLLGWTTEKNVKSPGARASIWIGGIIVLLSFRFWDSFKLSDLKLFLGFVLLAVASIPLFIV